VGNLKKIGIVGLILFVVLAFAKISIAEEDYFPLAVGNAWVYQTNFGPDVTIEIIDTENVSDVKCFVLEQSMKGAPQIPPMKRWYGRKNNEVGNYKSTMPQGPYMVDFVLEPAMIAVPSALSSEKPIVRNIRQKWTMAGQQGEYNTRQTTKVLGKEMIR